MSVQLKIGAASTFEIDGRELEKDSLSLQWTDGNTRLSIVHNGYPIYQNIHWSEFVDGDNADAAFSSKAALIKWLDSYTLTFLPYARPYKHISDATTNEKLVKAGQTILHKLTAVNAASATRYLKIYDKSSAPDVDTDVPLLVFPLVNKAEDTQENLLSSAIMFYNGLGFTITTGLDDDDDGSVVAGDIIVGIIYQ